ncbi:hypothetical protein C2S53_001309 [Perilla frutescens var. hirtella]|uniref:Uncharacterized protein n=1 Tax=Perilla frutescens var. hirtella TaxID=608512 RepID=A0AAD4JLS4_PERFH|nr:hypothetical protein C2S53_001309 [Perilla frutescens var. hirtella]
MRTICSQPSRNPDHLWQLPAPRTDPPNASRSCASLQIGDRRRISAEQRGSRHSDRCSCCRTVNLTPGCTQSDQSAAGNDESETMSPVPPVHDPTRAPHGSSNRESPSSGPIQPYSPGNGRNIRI